MSQDRTDTTQEVRGRMGFDEREALMLFLLRHQGVFLEAKAILKPEHFSEPYEVLWAICWQSMLDLYDQFSAMPVSTFLYADVMARVEERPQDLPVGAVEELRNFLEYIFAVEAEAVSGPYQQYGYDLLQKFLKERHWADPIKKYVEGLGPQVPVNIPDVLRDYSNRLAVIEGMRANVVEPLMPDQWEPVAVNHHPTGLRFIDEPMGGGWVSRETYGLLGPFGSGKTMLAGQIACQCAEKFVEAARAAQRPPKHVFFFSYEMPVDDLRRRCIAYLARVKLDHLATAPWTQTLSRPGRRHPYEDVIFPSDPRGEWERVQEIKPQADIFHIVNFRGDREAPMAGSGWVDEIHAELDKWQRRHGGCLEIGQVFIDYANIATRRYLKARGLDVDRHLRHYVGSFGDECRRLIADHFDCSVWILNQMSGEANKKGAGTLAHYTESAEARNFGENLAYAFVLGNKDPDNNCVQIGCGKTRRSQGVARPALLQLRGDLARFELADERYTVDTSSRRIIDRNLAEMAPASPRRSNGARSGIF